MDWYSSWFIDDYKAGVLVMMDNFDRSGGNRRFVTMDFMGNTVSISDDVGL